MLLPRSRYTDTYLCHGSCSTSNSRQSEIGLLLLSDMIPRSCKGELACQRVSQLAWLSGYQRPGALLEMVFMCMLSESCELQTWHEQSDWHEQCFGTHQTHQDCVQEHNGQTSSMKAPMASMYLGHLAFGAMQSPAEGIRSPRPGPSINLP